MFDAQAARWLVVLLILSWAVRAKADDSPGAIPAPLNASSANSEQDAAVQKALEERVDVSFDEITLVELRDYLRDRNIDLVLDSKALEEAGIDSDTALPPLKLQQVTLRSVLRHLIRQADVALLVRDGKLLLTTNDNASNELITKIYRVDDLVRAKRPDGTIADNYATITRLLTNVIKPASWDELGGPGTISGFQGVLVISTTDDAQDEIEWTLEALRKSLAEQAAETYQPHWADCPVQATFRKTIADKSQTRETLNLADSSLRSALDAIATTFAVQIVVDYRALEEAGVDLDTPSSIELREVTLPVALRRVLAPLDLAYLLQHEAVVVTTTDRASDELTTVVYPVGDLVGRTGYFNSLIDVITTTVRPDSWEFSGPSFLPASDAAKSLAFGQTLEVHEEVARLLDGLRKVRIPIPAESDAAAGSEDSGRPSSQTYLLREGIDPASIVSAVRQIDPPSWASAGALLRADQMQLTVRNSRAVQSKVRQFLTQTSALAAPSPHATGGMGGMGGGMMGGATGGMGGMGGGMGGMMGGGIGVPGGKH